MHEIDMKNYNIRTDLVIDIISSSNNNKGIFEKNYNIKGINISDIKLSNDNILNKKSGRYITISFSDVTDKTNKDNVTYAFIHALKQLFKELKIDKSKTCLVVGLGNSKSTPDALGPNVISNILVTRYLFNENNIDVEDGFRNVSAISPGVYGTTGIDSVDIIKGIVDKIKPDFLIVVDSLLSSSIDRINKTIQMTDTGIHPGSGVGNKRCEISFESIGLPVIAIGVPTVIDGVTIVADTISYIINKLSCNQEKCNKLDLNNDKENLFGVIGTLDDDELRELLFNILSPVDYNLIVTVKEIDFIIDKLVEIISFGINKCLHKKFDKNIY